MGGGTLLQGPRHGVVAEHAHEHLHADGHKRLGLQGQTAARTAEGRQQLKRWSAAQSHLIPLDGMRAVEAMEPYRALVLLPDGVQPVQAAALHHLPLDLLKLLVSAFVKHSQLPDQSPQPDRAVQRAITGAHNRKSAGGVSQKGRQTLAADRSKSYAKHPSIDLLAGLRTSTLAAYSTTRSSAGLSAVSDPWDSNHARAATSSSLSPASTCINKGRRPPQRQPRGSQPRDTKATRCTHVPRSSSSPQPQHAAHPRSHGAQLPTCVHTSLSCAP